MSRLDVYYIAMQVAGFVAVVLCGLRDRPFERVCRDACGIGLVVNLAIQLPEGGPGLCLGMIAFPLVACAVAGVVHGVAQAWRTIQRARVGPTDHQPRCRQCDYLLIGLPSDRCPECGLHFTRPRPPRRRPVGFVLDRWRRTGEEE